MPSVSTRTHRAVLNVRKAQVGDRFGKSLPFYASYLPADADYGERYLYPGMVLAYMDSNETYYVPYSLAASYGSSSDTAVAVMYRFWDATLETSPIIEPLTRGDTVEANCYVQGGTIGTISAAIKTSLSGIQWM